jgi:hypothetical protein
LTVDEPNVLGQLVGYAGYLDFVLLNPAAFLKASPTPVGTTRSGGGGTARASSQR